MKTVTITSNVTYSLVSVQDAAGCQGTVSGAAVFTLGNAAGFVINSDVEICAGESATLTFDLSGTGPFDVVYNNGSGNTNLNGISDGHTISVMPQGTTSYSPVSVVDANGCSGSGSGNATVTVLPDIAVSNLEETCNGANTSYVVTFQVSGGTPGTYQVTGGGTFDPGTNTFTSSSISSGDTYLFSVSDANCGPLSIEGGNSCDCDTEAGTMGPNPKLVCESASVTMDYNNDGTLDANDVLGYVLHDSPGPGLGNVMATSLNPVFAYQAPMNFEVPYYVSAVIGK